MKVFQLFSLILLFSLIIDQNAVCQEPVYKAIDIISKTDHPYNSPFSPLYFNGFLEWFPTDEFEYNNIPFKVKNTVCQITDDSLTIPIKNSCAKIHLLVSSMWVWKILGEDLSLIATLTNGEIIRTNIRVYDWAAPMRDNVVIQFDALDARHLTKANIYYYCFDLNGDYDVLRLKIEKIPHWFLLLVAITIEQ